MGFNVATLYHRSTVVWARNFKFVDEFRQAHVRLESIGQLNLAVRALALGKPAEALLADEGTALLAVEGRVRKFKAHNAAHVIVA